MTRRRARETALQILFQIDVGQASPEAAIEHVLTEFPLSEPASEFAVTLVRGALKHLREIDQVIKELSREWNLDRMAKVDRNILRLAIYEILYVPEVPNNVAINEAIEVAKKFGGGDSGRFVNGILGKLVESRED
ncbi:MAG: transcription antitermination factor NusB [Firmicutes bacterium]|nr:transcription antitermination factor NusB [Bacillota bacterium]